jgi:hypothetical protein
MRNRYFVSMGALAVVITVMSFASGTVAGQTAKANTTAAKSYNPPRTPDGQPDLSGVWSHNAATPLERPKELAGKQFLTDDELAALKKRAAELFNDDAGDAAFGNVFVGALTNTKYQARDGVGNYNQFWLVNRDFDNRTSLIVDPPDGRLPALTAEAQQRQAAAAEYSRLHYADGPEDVPHNCWGGNLPMLGAGYNSYHQIVQSAGSVAINMEMMHDARIVSLDGRAPLPETIQQRLGSSRGHWDGDTLVVDTTNFRDRSQVELARQGGGRVMTSTTHLTERFTRVSANTLKYEVTVTDPATYTKPWTAVAYWKAEPKDQVYEYACHEGNEAMAGTLSGYRALQKAAEDAAKKGSN